MLMRSQDSVLRFGENHGPTIPFGASVLRSDETAGVSYMRRLEKT
jgi:hypothetical protein